MFVWVPVWNIKQFGTLPNQKYICAFRKYFFYTYLQGLHTVCDKHVKTYKLKKKKNIPYTFFFLRQFVIVTTI